ncbi:hypothetical protein YC2023_041499 [Brassica napus]
MAYRNEEEGSIGTSMHEITAKEHVFSFSDQGEDTRSSHSVQSEDPTAKFALPVNSEHKAKIKAKWPLGIVWVKFLGSLHLGSLHLDSTKTDIGNAGVASISGAIFSRLAMGAVCDLLSRLVTQKSCEITASSL